MHICLFLLTEHQSGIPPLMLLLLFLAMFGISSNDSFTYAKNKLTTMYALTTASISFSNPLHFMFFKYMKLDFSAFYT